MGRRFTSLDGLRGVAALAVLVRHVPDRTLARDWMSGSYLAVDLFFLLSGFVLAHAYEERLADGLSLGRFFKLRLARLYPLHLAGLGLAALVIAYKLAFESGVTPRTIAASFIPALFFLPTPPAFAHFENAFPANFPVWSLSWELAANLLFGLMLTRGLMRRWTWPVILAGLVGLVTLTLHRGNIDAGAAIREVWWGAPRVAFAFFLGVVIHRLWAEGRLKLAMPFWLSAALLLIVFAAPLHGTARAVWDLLAAIVFLPGIVALSLGQGEGPVASRLGAASYGVYVLQAPTIVLVIKATSHTPFPLWSLGVPGTFAVAALVFAFALWMDRAYDAPVRRWLSARVMAGAPVVPANTQRIAS